jgi:hypothetical protein
VLDDGKTKLALVVLDLLGINYGVSHEARKFIEQEAGIPSAIVLISAVHTHSAASALSEMHFEFRQKIDKYQAFVARWIADGVKCAVHRLRPAQLGFTTAQAPEHVFNRRWFLKPGSMPNEVFCEIGLDFCKRSPVQPAFLVSLAHGYFDYLPTPKQHELGGYETWLATNRLEPKASEKMLDALLEMAAEVRDAK